MPNFAAHTLPTASAAAPSQPGPSKVPEYARLMISGAPPGVWLPAGARRM